MRNGFTRSVILVFVGLLLCSVGCQGERVQSSLHPEGPAAESVARLWWVMLTVLGLYTLGVFVLATIAVFRRPTQEPKQPTNDREGRRFILIGGAILPTIILVPTLAYTVHTTSSLRMRDTGLTIRVVGHRWWWEVEYPDHRILTANELVIPMGEPVKLELSSADVIHSFWVPQLHGKMDMIPGTTTKFWLQADREGIYRGQCAEYCGLQHAHMAFVVKSLPPDKFVRWLENSASATTVTEDGRGFQLFKKHGCSVCHAIQGTEAKGWSGPDLTLIATRETLAAGTIENTPQNLLQWLVTPQSIKPGVNMPATEASAEELQMIVDFLLKQNGSSTERGDDDE